MFEFSQETSKLLHNAGWYEDRESSDVSEYIKALERAGFHVSDAVKDFLYHFGGLSVKHPHAKIKEKTDYFHFDVIKALNSGDPSWVLEEYSSRINKELCIIGEAFRRSLILCMSPDKRVYAGIDDALFLVGESGELAIEALCQGSDLEEIPERANDEVELMDILIKRLLNKEFSFYIMIPEQIYEKNLESQLLLSFREDVMNIYSYD